MTDGGTVSELHERSRIDDDTNDQSAEIIRRVQITVRVCVHCAERVPAGSPDKTEHRNLLSRPGFHIEALEH